MPVYKRPVGAVPILQHVAAFGPHQTRMMARDFGVIENDIRVFVPADDNGVPAQLVDLAGFRPLNHDKLILFFSHAYSPSWRCDPRVTDS
jgi:hypothetical protein